MGIFGLLVLFSVSINAEINKLFFSGSNTYIDCPGEATFYQWKRYHSGNVRILLSEDKRRIMVPLKADSSPITYQCSGTNGFINYNENITIFVLDQDSSPARKLCAIRKISSKMTAQYPCFLQYQKEPVMLINRGSPVSLDCEAGGTNVTYTWYQLNTPASHQELLSDYYNVPVLRMPKANSKTPGQYLCIVNTTNGDNLKRYFDVRIFENASSNINSIFIDGPSVINVSAKLLSSHELSCRAEALDTDSIRSVQWAKKVNSDVLHTDKNLVIEWENTVYKLIPDHDVHTNHESGTIITSSLMLKTVTGDSAGQYICGFFTNVGKMKHKTFILSVEQDLVLEQGSPRLLTLYILIPSLVIAVCVFVGIYLAINRISVRKSSHSGTGTSASNSGKSDKDVLHMRTTPDNSVSSYPSKSPLANQYMMHNNYQSPYYAPSDKLML